ncbi:hypothetical protein [Streptomyces sp. CA-132043]|uniref:hypothetical protein n=1 Tax=Streptomyces sp. CA-132043 TaxID=3240048 RepID=UPI003D92D9E7
MNTTGPATPLSRGTRARRWTRRLAATLSLTLLPSTLAPTALAADRDPLGRPGLKAPRSAPLHPVSPKVSARLAAQLRKAAADNERDARRARTDQHRTTTWPTPATAHLTTGKPTANPGHLPLTLTAPQGKSARPARSVGVTVHDQATSRALGIKGLVLTATGPAAGGTAQLSLKYAAFASAYGGDYAGRLQLKRLPACALTTPHKAACRHQTPLRASNQRTRDTLTAPVTFAAAPGGGQTMVLALAPGPSPAPATTRPPRSPPPPPGKPAAPPAPSPGPTPAHPAGRRRTGAGPVGLLRLRQRRRPHRQHQQPRHHPRRGLRPPLLLRRTQIRLLRRRRADGQVRPVLEVRQRLPGPQRQVHRTGQGRHLRRLAPEGR